MGNSSIQEVFSLAVPSIKVIEPNSSTSLQKGLVFSNGSGLFCFTKQFILSFRNKIQLSLILSSESHLI